MSTAVLFYSLGGTTRTYCEKLAAEQGADVFEVKERRPHNGFTAFLPGCIQSGSGSASEIIAPGADLNKYDEIVVAGPIWAGNPAPAVNAIIGLLPQGKSVTFILLSGSGKQPQGRAVEAIKAQGCTVKEVRGVSSKQVTG
ncbi:MAG: hypothetical protein LBT52_03350 [Clostridiales Family XIII bacterium]|jgi:flavodoxin|nr:hypothetical protein [Clostridiales Family XIII bacterium]